MDNSFASRLNTIKAPWVFLMLWVITFVLYIATARGGWVIDAAGFLYNMKHQSFWDFINRTNSTDQSFYQLLTLHYYIFYKIWGFNTWLWGILYITIQALNATLFFVFFRNILTDSGIKKSTLLPLVGVLIFTCSPYISEILVCRAYYHYLQSFFFIFLILLWIQKYMHSQQIKYIWYSIIVFVLCAFTLEIFYLIPILALTVMLYYRYALNYDKIIFRKTLAFFFVPQLVMLGLYFVALLATFKNFKPHKIDLHLSVVDYLSKLPKYLFHIVFLGRFFPPAIKDKVYAACESPVTLIILYGLLLFVFVYAIGRLSKISSYSKAMFLLFTLAIINICFLMPLPFPGSALLVFYDRYTYFTDAFVYLLLAMLVAKWVQNKYVLIVLFCACVDLNLFFTIQLNTYWMESDVINTRLLRHLPDPGAKTVLLLNLPENMNGAPMIGAQPEGMYKMMKETLSDTILSNNIYDVASYNMTNDYDGANVTVINDSVIRVTLNHTGNWWWYEGHGARSYETPDYSVNMKDPGRWYEITLKHPASQYLLLYSVGDKWKTADMSKLNVQQD